MKAIFLFGLSLVMTPLVGCSTWNKELVKHLPWSPESRLAKSKFQTPAKMIAIWTPDVLSTTGRPPTRGFGGRLYFYNERSQAIPVDGQLMVYAYNDSEDKHQSGEPDRKFAFTPDQFTAHYSKSDLGASYSVWIPWDAVGGEQQSISLVPVFTATSGQVVIGHQASSVLPGRHKEGPTSSEQLPVMSRIPPTSGVQPVAHYESTTPAPMQDNSGTGDSTMSQMRTSTIALPRSLQQQLMQQSSAAQMNNKPFGAGSATAEMDHAPNLDSMRRVPNVGLQSPAGPTANEIQTPSQAITPAPSPAQQQSARFEHAKYPARGALTAQAWHVDSPSSRFHAAPPSRQSSPSTPTLPTQIPATSGPAPGNSW